MEVSYIQWLKPLADITFADIVDAIKAVKVSRGNGKVYSDATMGVYVSMLNDIFRYAEDREEAENVVLHYLPGRSTLMSQKSKAYIAPDKVDVILLSVEQEKKKNKRRSLNLCEFKKLYKLISSNLLIDGRWCIIAIVLYTGLRPSEARAVCWSDIVPIPGYDDAYELIADKTLARNGIEFLDTMKTSNAYRKIPVHPELMELLVRRRRFVEEQTGMPAGPIGCLENDFDRPCTVAQLGIFAKKQLQQILDDEMLQVNALDAAIEDAKSNYTGKNTSEESLTLYVLRRNFATMATAWMRMTPMEVRYCMGHRMSVDGINIRERYNDPDVLYNIGLKMRRFYADTVQHESAITDVLGGDQTGCARSGVGLRLLRIHHDALRDGYVRIHVTGKLPAEEIRLEALTKLRDIGGLDVEYHMIGMEPDPDEHPRVDTESDIWHAMK